VLYAKGNGEDEKIRRPKSRRQIDERPSLKFYYGIFRAELSIMRCTLKVLVDTNFDRSQAEAIARASPGGHEGLLRQARTEWKWLAVGREATVRHGRREQSTVKHRQATDPLNRRSGCGPLKIGDKRRARVGALVQTWPMAPWKRRFYDSEAHAPNFLCHRILTRESGSR